MNERYCPEKLSPDNFNFESFKPFSQNLIGAALFDAQTNRFAKLIFMNEQEYTQMTITQKLGEFFVSGEIIAGCENDVIIIPLALQQPSETQADAPKAEELDFGKFQKISKGLISAPIIDSVNGQLLMVGYMDKESLGQTLSSKNVVFFSRSKNTIWRKGETSGNFLYVKSIFPTNDMTSITIRAVCLGPVCHENKKTCFDKEKFDKNQQSLSYTLKAIDQIASI